MMLVVGAVLFTPQVIIIRKLTAHAFEAVILFLASAIGFMILERPRLLFTCLGMAMILSLYLKEKSKSGIPAFLFGKTNDFSICQVLINGGSDQYKSFSNRLLASDADIIQVQETTPDWVEVLKNSLKLFYPYSSEMNRIDPYGMMIFSKYPIKKTDTLIYEDTTSRFTFPALKFIFDIKNHEVEYIACHILPRLNTNDFDKVQGVFTMLADWVKKNQDKTVIVSGELGLTPWDYALQQFITSSGLELSRREPHLFVQPFEHILYSPALQCLRLKEVLAPGRNHIGIQGEYAFK